VISDFLCDLPATRWGDSYGRYPMLPHWQTCDLYGRLMDHKASQPEICRKRHPIIRNKVQYRSGSHIRLHMLFVPYCCNLTSYVEYCAGIQLLLGHSSELVVVPEVLVIRIVFKTARRWQWFLLEIVVSLMTFAARSDSNRRSLNQIKPLDCKEFAEIGRGTLKPHFGSWKMH
jgi:hypothetical protein